MPTESKCNVWEETMPVSLTLIEQLREFETALIAEAMSAMGVPHSHEYYTGSDVRLLTSTLEPMVGVALTMTVDTSTVGRAADSSELWEGYARIQESRLPIVVVMACLGSNVRRECVAGDGMVKSFKTYGACGLVTDGGARDIERINKVGFALYGSGTVTDHATLVYHLTQQPVSVSGVTFANGDLVHADNDGVLLVPAVCHAGIVEACTLARDFETRAHLIFRRTDLNLPEKQRAVAELWEAHQTRCRPLLTQS